MFRTLAATVVFAATAAPAQITSYQTDRLAPVKGDAHKIVCKKDETIGTRLGAKKVCMTVREWQERVEANREETERAQLNTQTRPSN